MWSSLSDTIVIHLKVGTCIVKVELVTTLKRQATKILQDLHTSKEPVLITEHGQPSAYLVDVDDYEMMQKRMSILEGIAKGEQAIHKAHAWRRHEHRRSGPSRAPAKGSPARAARSWPQPSATCGAGRRFRPGGCTCT